MVLLAATTCQTTPTPKQLATDQTLRIAIPHDTSALAPLDPAQITDPVMFGIGNNIFGGLYRYEDDLREQPYIAAQFPDVSSDGQTYTFHLRKDATFSNGDPVTASDFVYSWNRAADSQAGFADVAFGPIDGYQAVVAAAAAMKTPPPMTGLSAPDARTLVVHLTAPSGAWLAATALPAAWVLDKKVIAENGEATWWMTPGGLVGTGPFKLTARVPNESLVFTPIDHWWYGSTGLLTRVELRVVSEVEPRWEAYRAGTVDVLGFGLPEHGTGVPELASTDGPQLESLRADPVHRAEIHAWTYGRSEWLGFNFEAGPFSEADGHDLRLAFSEAIDRGALAQAVCDHGWDCEPASGGLIARGLHGYLGDGADPTARFNPSQARATITRLDPSGSRLRGLVYYYAPASPFLNSVAKNLHDQWKANLGLDVTVRALDRTAFFADRARGRLTLFRGGWAADYDHPQDWFDNLFTTSAEQTNGNAGSGFSSPSFDAIVAKADREPLVRALPDYQQAGRMLLDDGALAVLFYYRRTEVVKPYVGGYGVNPLWEYRWTSIWILQH
jgi:oligopeptide transport system substrate-binding protein